MRLVAGLLALGAATASAYGAVDVMSGYFGNTVVVRRDHAVLYLHYKPDHTFDGVLDDLKGKRQFTGTWTRDADGRLCRKLDQPKSGYAWSPIPGAADAIKDFALGPAALDPECVEVSAHLVGDNWIESADGQQAAASLVTGVKD